MADPRSAGVFAALRAAARVARERFLVGISDDKERARVAAALGAEGTVVDLASSEQALDRLAEEPFELAVLELDREQNRRDPHAAARELRPFTDLVLVGGGDPEHAAELYARDVAAVLP